MRVFFFLIALIMPMASLAEPICPAGYVLGRYGLCEQQWNIPTGNCPEGSYYDRKVRDCLPRCPYRSRAEISSRGDRVCQLDGKREWLAEYMRKCAEKGMAYQPQINMCLVPPKKNPTEQETQIADCPKGKVWNVKNGAYKCVKGDPQRVARQLQQRLRSKGLSYIEYLEALKDIQTNRLAAEVMQYRWEEATGRRQSQDKREAAIKAATRCPDQYIPTVEGGCKPVKSCSAYGCPKGQVSRLLQRGRNLFCQCVPQ